MYAFVLGPSGNYWEILFFHIAIGISQVMIGGLITVVLMYTMRNDFEDKHLALCTFGHYFLAQALLVFNYANGWSSPLRYRHRIIVHAIAQCIGFSCTVAGIIMAPGKKGLSKESHGLTGQISAVFALVTLALGPVATFLGRIGKIAHMTFGIPTFVVSSVSLCYGLTGPDFKGWAGIGVTKMLVTFVVFYSIFIFFMSIVQYLQKIISFKSYRADDDDDE